MSPLGLITVKNDAESSVTVSGETASKVDREISALVEQAYQSALTVLREKRSKLIQIAEHLMQVETIDGSELDSMLFSA